LAARIVWITLPGEIIAIGWWNDGRVIAMELINNLDIGAAVLPSQESANGRV
jgi:hypothetical protein